MSCSPPAGRAFACPSRVFIICGGWNFQLINSRLKGREGPRIAGPHILIDGCYIECSGSGDDHGDGIQAYIGPNGPYTTKNVIIRNTKVVMLPGANNAGIFLANNAGVELVLENVFVDGDGSPNGAIAINQGAVGEISCRSQVARNVIVKTTNNTGRGLDIRPSSKINIIEWTNVRWADGRPIPRPGRLQAPPN